MSDWSHSGDTFRGLMAGLLQLSYGSFKSCAQVISSLLLRLLPVLLLLLVESLFCIRCCFGHLRYIFSFNFHHNPMRWILSQFTGGDTGSERCSKLPSIYW